MRYDLTAGSSLECPSSGPMVAISMDKGEIADHDPRWPVAFEREAGVVPPALARVPDSARIGGRIERPEILSLRR